MAEIAESRSDDLKREASDLVTNFGFDLPLLEGAIWAALERVRNVERDRLTDPAFLAKCIQATGMVGKEAVDEAIAVERERCAQLVFNMGEEMGTRASTRHIASAIRNPHTNTEETK